MEAVYKITSKKLNTLLYIGSSLKYNYRISSHLSDLRNKRHKNYKLQNHVNEFGIEDIIFSIIEEIFVKDILIEREQYYLDTLNPICNLCPNAKNKTGWKASKETCNKIGKGQPKRKSKHRFGQREKSDRMKGNSHALGYEHSQEAKERISKNHFGIRPVFQYSMKGDFIKEWECGKWASNELNINQNSIYRCAKGFLPHAGFFKWYYNKL